MVMYAGHTFAKWYIAKLKAYPMMTNMGSAVLLMTTGDVLAQKVEDKAQKDQQQAMDIGDLDANGYQRIKSKPQQHSLEFNVITTTPVSYTLSSLSSALEEEESDDDLNDSATKLNPFRTGTMVAWAVGAYTPFYVALYNLYDKLLPTQTPASVAARVVLSFICSIPVNGAFYVYGTAVNHTSDWLTVRHELQKSSIKAAQGDADSNQEANQKSLPAFEWDQLWTEAGHKLEAELGNTIVTSGTCWIPINMFTFTVVPAHLRPLSLMFFSIFWNCYLSLSQHRNIKPEDMDEQQEEQRAMIVSTSSSSKSSS